MNGRLTRENLELLETVPPSPSQLPTQVIWRETVRRKLAKLGDDQRALQQQAAIDGQHIPPLDHSHVTMEWFSEPPAQLNDIPLQKFCVPNLADDGDAIYGRIQWTESKHAPLSLEARQKHADDLAQRFLGAAYKSQGEGSVPQS